MKKIVKKADKPVAKEKPTKKEMLLKSNKDWNQKTKTVFEVSKAVKSSFVITKKIDKVYNTTSVWKYSKFSKHSKKSNKKEEEYVHVKRKLYIRLLVLWLKKKKLLSVIL